MLDMIIERHGNKPDRDLLLLILAEQLIINQKLDKMANELQNLKDAQARALTLEELALQLLAGQKTTIDGLKQQLADAIAAGSDPAAIQAVADSMNEESDKLDSVLKQLQPPAQSSGDGSSTATNGAGDQTNG